MDPSQPVIDVDLAHPATPISEGQEQSEAPTSPSTRDNASTPDNDVEMATGSTAVNETLDTTVDEDTSGNTQQSVGGSVMDFEEYYGTTYLADPMSAMTNETSISTQSSSSLHIQMPQSLFPTPQDGGHPALEFMLTTFRTAVEQGVPAPHSITYGYDGVVAGLTHEQQPNQSPIAEPVTSAHLNSTPDSNTISPVTTPEAVIPVLEAPLIAPAPTTLSPSISSSSTASPPAAAVLSDAARAIITEQAGGHLQELQKLVRENGAKSFYRERLMAHSIALVEQKFFPPPSQETEATFSSGTHTNVKISRTVINEWAREHGYSVKASTAANHRAIWGPGAVRQLHKLQAANRVSPSDERGECIKLLELIIEAVYIGPSPDIGSIEAKALQLNQKAWHCLMKTGDFLAS